MGVNRETYDQVAYGVALTHKPLPESNISDASCCVKKGILKSA
jgi:hypothetical protein